MSRRSQRRAGCMTILALYGGANSSGRGQRGFSRLADGSLKMGTGTNACAALSKLVRASLAATPSPYPSPGGRGDSSLAASCQWHMTKQGRNRRPDCGHAPKRALAVAAAIMLALAACKPIPAMSLHEAARKGDLDQIRANLARGKDVNGLNSEGVRPLHLAALLGRKDAAGLLLERGADVNLQSRSGSAPLHFAVGSLSREVVELILSKGANVNARDSGYRTALHSSVEKGQLEIARLLLDKGADVNARRYNGTDALQTAAVLPDIELVKLLIERGADVNVKYEYPKDATPLHVAAARGDIEFAHLLIGKGVDVNARDVDGFTAILLAANGGRGAFGAKSDPPIAAAEARAFVDLVLDPNPQYDRRAFVELLIGAGADVNCACSRCNVTPLHIASLRGDRETAAILLANKAAVNARDYAQLTPLHYAVECPSPEAAQLLLANGADANAPSPQYGTPLHLAAGRDEELARVLLDKGADVRAIDGEGSTPLHRAMRTEVAKALIAAGADVNAADNLGRTPLHLAAIYSRNAVIEILLDNGADLSRKDNSGLIAASYARQNANWDLFNFLQGKGASK